MSGRNEIIEELFRSELITDYSDLSIVASALDYGLSADYILNSALVGRWPRLVRLAPGASQGRSDRYCC